MQRIIIDTSSIVFAFSNKLDIFALVEERLGQKAVVSLGIMRELRGLASRKSREGRAAKLAIQVIKKHGVEIMENTEKADDLLLRLGGRGEMGVCTNDIKLRRRLRSRGVRAFSVSRSGVLR